MFIQIVLTIQINTDNKIEFKISNTGEVTYIENYTPSNCRTFYVRPLIFDCNKRSIILKVVSSRRVVETTIFTSDNNCSDIEDLFQSVTDYFGSDTDEIHHLLRKSIEYYNNFADYGSPKINTCRCHGCTQDTQ